MLAACGDLLRIRLLTQGMKNLLTLGDATEARVGA